MQKPLVTQCPHCYTRFQLTIEQLHAADGVVRCGRCEAIFSAERHLETAPSEPLPPPTEERATPCATEAYLESLLSQEIKPAEPATEAPSPQPRRDDAAPQPRNQLGQLPPEPVLLTALPKRRSPWVTTFWTLAALVLLLGTLGQYAWFERDRLNADPRLAPLYQQLCQHVECRLRPAIDIAAIHTHQLLVRDHPHYQQALSIDLLLENRAAFEQPFPALKLVFETLEGAPTVARVIQPHQYLQGDFRAGSLMPRNKTVQLHLEFEAPGQPSPAYRLDLVPAQRISP